MKLLVCPFDNLYVHILLEIFILMLLALEVVAIVAVVVVIVVVVVNVALAVACTYSKYLLSVELSFLLLLGIKICSISLQFT